MEIINGKIILLDERGMTIYADYGNIDRAVTRQYDIVEVGLPDGRTIIPEQRKFAYALIGDISDYAGYAPDYIKRLMKLEFVAAQLRALEKEIFSLSNCDVTTASEFITYLIDFILEHDIPTKEPLKDACDDIRQYVYACLIHKKCAVCQKSAEIHHFDAIGMGRDRKEIPQLGMMVISLCRKCHTVARAKGKSWLTDDQHLEAIPLNEVIAKKYKLTKK